MIWLTAKQQAKTWVAAVALVATCGAAVAGSDAEQFARFKDANQWGAPAGDLNQTRYSSLKDINAGNVKDLQMSWAQSTGALRGHEGQPLVINDVGGKPMMFFISGCPDMSKCNIVQALDLSNPDQPVQVWHYMKTSGRDESAVPRACCDTVNRGGSYADGKFVFGTLDGYLIALDAATGKEAWVVKHAHPDKGETITPAPIIVNDKVFIGFGGDEFAARGRVTGLCAGRRQEGVGVLQQRHRQRHRHDRQHEQGASRIRHRRQGTRDQDLSGRRVDARWRSGVGLVCLRSGPAPGLLRNRQSRPVEPVLPLRRQAADASRLQRRFVGQQVVDVDLRAQRGHRRSGVGLPEDTVRPVGL
jgi:glucose dehydrogenase